MKCPKCAADMRSYERNGITIDQCGECRGIFLDRGELDRLIDVEAAASPPAQTYATVQPMPQVRPQQQWGHDDDSRHYSGHKRKKKSFLSEMFDD